MANTIKQRIKHSFVKLGQLKSALNKINAAIALGNNTQHRTLFFNGKRFTNSKKNTNKRTGCNIYGYAFGEFGLGEHIKCITRSCLANDIPTSVYNYEALNHRQNDLSLTPYIDQTSQHNINLFGTNNDTVLTIHQQNPSLFKDRYNIGYGLWELSDYPNEWLFAMNLLDEIWAPSQFIQEIMAAKSSIPVLLMPLAVDFQLSKVYTRKSFNIPDDKFIFLFSFDFASQSSRKNPQAVIEAFKKAFPDNNSACTLVIKCKVYKEVPHQVTAYNKMLAALQDRPDIMVIAQTLKREEVLGLLNCADCYISLHRAEGYGLGMAESMKMGKPVIATGYSGNLDFMNHQNSYLVDYQLIKVKPGEYFDLEGDSVWAEPDIEQAAYYMRNIIANPNAAMEKGKLAQQTINNNLNFRTVGAAYKKRLQFINLL